MSDTLLPPTSSRPGRGPGLVLLLALVCVPLPAACMAPEPRAWLAALLCAAGALVALLVASGRCRVVVPPLLLVPAGLAALAFAQLLPLSPGHGEAALAFLPMEPSTWTVVPGATAQRARELLALVVLGILVATFVARRSAPRDGEDQAMVSAPLVWTLLVTAAALSLHGLLVWNGVLPRPWPDQPSEVVHGTWFNRNHFAGFLTLAVLAGAGALAGWYTVARHTGAGSLCWLLCGLSLVALCGTTLMLTGSRGGWLSAVVGALVLTVLVARRFRGIGAWQVGLLLAVLLLVSVAAGAEGLGNRLKALTSDLETAGMRPDIWRGALALVAAFPIGSGFGTYAHLSPFTQPAAVPGRLEHAHSEPLELLLEGGPLALLLVLIGIVLAARQVWRRVPGLPAGEAWLLSGVAAALCAALVHALVEFSFKVPANACWIMALAVFLMVRIQQAPGSNAGRTGRTVQAQAHGLGHRTRFAAAAVALLLTASAWTSMRQGIAEGLVTQAARAEPAQRALLAEQALQWHRGHGRAMVERAAALGADGKSNPSKVKAQAEQALQVMPFSPLAARTHALACLAAGDPGAFHALRHALAVVNPHERPRVQLELAVQCIVRGHLDAGRTLVQNLLRKDPKRARHVFSRIYEQVPVAELLYELVPPEQQKTLSILAQLLLDRSDLHGREVVLAAARGQLPVPGHWTLEPGDMLTGVEVEEQEQPDGLDLQVVLLVARADPEQKAPVVTLRWQGAQDLILRTFPLQEGRNVSVVRLDGSYPPGRYELVLEFSHGRGQLPLHRVELLHQDLVLVPGALVPAGRLHRMRPPGAVVSAPSEVVPVAEGDRLQRRVHLPAGRKELLVRCMGPALVAVALDGVDLPQLSARGLATARFAVPAEASSGLLQLRITGSDVNVASILLRSEGER